MVDEQTIDQAVAVITVLADRHRLAILGCLRMGELRAGDVHRRIGITQPLASYHLRVLSEAGFAHARWDGNARYYVVDLVRWDSAVDAMRAVLAPES